MEASNRAEALGSKGRAVETSPTCVSPRRCLLKSCPGIIQLHAGCFPSAALDLCANISAGSGEVAGPAQLCRQERPFNFQQFAHLVSLVGDKFS